MGNMNDAGLHELEQELHVVKLHFRLTAAVSFAVLAAGSVIFHLIEHFSWVNSLYFCTATLTTVGYGDIVPKTDAGKLFDVVYMLVGIGILANFARLIVQNASLRAEIKQVRRGVASRLK